MAGEALNFIEQLLSLDEIGQNIMVDGDFGKITLGAVLAFQLENGLDVDGMVGPQTKKQLKI
mgnify:CR=1 FL=1